MYISPKQKQSNETSFMEQLKLACKSLLSLILIRRSMQAKNIRKHTHACTQANTCTCPPPPHTQTKPLKAIHSYQTCTFDDSFLQILLPTLETSDENQSRKTCNMVLAIHTYLHGHHHCLWGLIMTWHDMYNLWITRNSTRKSKTHTIRKDTVPNHGD